LSFPSSSALVAPLSSFYGLFPVPTLCPQPDPNLSQSLDPDCAPSVFLLLLRVSIASGRFGEVPPLVRRRRVVTFFVHCRSVWVFFPFLDFFCPVLCVHMPFSSLSSRTERQPAPLFSSAAFFHKKISSLRPRDC